MILFVDSQHLPAIIFVFVVSMINIPISGLLSRIRLALVWVVPVLLFVVGSTLLLMAQIGEGWAVLIFMFYAFLLLGASVGTALSSLVIFLRKRKNT